MGTGGKHVSVLVPPRGPWLTYISLLVAGLILLGLPTDTAHDNTTAQTENWRNLPAHPEEDQVQKDVDRAFIYYPRRTFSPPPSRPRRLHPLSPSVTLPCKLSCGRADKSADDEIKRKQQLSDVILEVLRRNPHLRYFQGYHDICQVFLLVLGPGVAVRAVTKLSNHRVRDFMLPTLDASIEQLRLIPEILFKSDPELFDHLNEVLPFIALSNVITMYAHNIQSLGDIARVFDVLLAREPIFSLYLFVAIICGRRDELWEVEDNETAELTYILSKLPKPLDLESLIWKASDMAYTYPPADLPGWSRLSRYSVLKTALAPESEREAQQHFQAHAKEIAATKRRREQLRRVRALALRFRRPAQRAFGIAVLVGVLAIVLRAGPRGPIEYLIRYLPRLGGRVYD